MYICNQCSSAYVWPDSLKRHLKYKHGDNESGIPQQQQQQQLLLPLMQQQQQQQKEYMFQHPFTANLS
jgi:hypothetical protein